MTRVRAMWACAVFGLALAGCRSHPYCRVDGEVMKNSDGSVVPWSSDAQGELDDPTVVPGEWKRGAGWFADAPAHLTPDRIEGGIY